MRLALFTLCSLLLVCTVGSGQAGKKDGKPDEAKKKFEATEVGGKSVEGWTHEFASKDPSKREQAMRMVMMFPPTQSKEAVGPLLKELKKHTASKPIDLSVRISGCLALGSILASLKDGDVDKDDRKHVDEAVTLLKGFCKDSQVIVRTRAVQALGQLARRFSDKVTPALNEVIHVANDADTWEARQAGLDTLTLLAIIEAYKNKDKGPISSTVWTTFQKRLDDNSMQVRITALKSLAQFAQPPVTLAKASLSERALVKHIESVARDDPEPTVRIWGGLALMTLQHRVDKERIGPIAKILQDPNMDIGIRIQAAQSLGMVGAQLQDLRHAKDPPKVPPIIGKDVDKFIFDSLVITLSDDNLSMVAVGMSALAQSDPALAVGPVVDKLRSKEQGLRAEAAKVLASIGKQAQAGGKGSLEVRKAVRNALQATLNDTDINIVAVGMSALGHADPLGAVNPVVGILLNRKEAALRAQAAKVLADISAQLRLDKQSPRTDAEGPLIAKLKDSEPTVVVNCINALVQMDSEEAMPTLQEMSVDPHQQEVVKDAAKQAVKLIREQKTAAKKQADGKNKATPR